MRVLTVREVVERCVERFLPYPHVEVDVARVRDRAELFRRLLGCRGGVGWVEFEVARPGRRRWFLPEPVGLLLFEQDVGRFGRPGRVATMEDEPEVERQDA